MVNISAGHFKKINGYVHKATSYLLYDTQDIENAEPIARYEYSRKFKNRLIDNIDIPIGERWYCKIIMHMGFERLDAEGNDDNYNPVLDANCGTIEEVVEVMDQREATSRMLLKEEVEVDMPFISIDKGELDDDEYSYFTAKTSSFRGKGDAHVATHWVVENRFGTTIFSSLGDKTNLTSIKLHKEEILKGMTSIRILCWHETVCGILSPRGELEVILGVHNFEIISDLHNLPATTDYRLTLKRIDTNKPTGIMKIEIRDGIDENTLWAIQVKDQTAEAFILPWNLFAPASNLVLCIYTVDNYGTLTQVKRRLSVRSIKTYDIEDAAMQHNIIYHKPYLQKGLELLPYVTTMQLRQANLIPLPSTKDNKLHLYEMNTKTRALRDTTNVLPGVTLITPENEDTLIRLTVDDYLIIDTLNENKKPTFLVYKFNIARQTFEFLHSKIRADEKYPTGRNGSLVQHNMEEFFYLPVDTGTIRRYNFVKNRVEVLANSGISNPTHGVILPMRNGRLLLFAGEEFMSRTYIIAENRFVDGISIRPQSFINRALTAVQLNNGSTLIYKREPEDGDEENDSLYFSYAENKFIQIGHKFNPRRYPTTTIELLSGGLLLASKVDEQQINPDGGIEEVVGTQFQYFN